MEEQTLNDKIAKVYLLCQLGKAWFKQGEQLFLLSVNKMQPEPCGARDIGILYNTDPEVVEKENLTSVEARHELKTCYSCYMALSFAVDGFDTDLIESRRMGIKRANELCQDPKIWEFVRNRLLGCPVPKEADVKGAMKLAKKENASYLLEIYNEMLVEIIFGFLKSQSVAIDNADEDQSTASWFETLLSKRGVSPVNLSQHGSTEAPETKPLGICGCGILIIVYDKAPLSWLSSRLKHYRTIQIRRKQLMTIMVYSPKIQSEGILLPETSLPKGTILISQPDKLRPNRRVWGRVNDDKPSFAYELENASVWELITFVSELKLEKNDPHNEPYWKRAA